MSLQAFKSGNIIEELLSFNIFQKFPTTKLSFFWFEICFTKLFLHWTWTWFPMISFLPNLLLWRKLVFTGSSVEENKNPRTESLADKQLVFQISLGSNPEKKADAGSVSGSITEKSKNDGSQLRNSLKISGSSCDPGMEISSCCCPLAWLWRVDDIVRLRAC